MNISKLNVFKIILGGDGGIGKTTLAKVLCGADYSDQDMTIGVDVFVKNIYINGIKETLQIWDLSGQDHFRFLLPDYFMGAHGVVLGFDMSRRISFLNLRTWMSILMGKCPQASVVLIATKADMGYHPTVSQIMAKEFIEKFDIIDFVEVSAKDKINIETPFIKLIEHIKGLEPGTAQIILEVPEAPTVPEPVEVSKVTEPILLSKEVSTKYPLIMQCPYCNHPLREVQIKLKQAGREILCRNCFKMI